MNGPTKISYQVLEYSCHECVFLKCGLLQDSKRVGRTACYHPNNQNGPCGRLMNYWVMDEQIPDYTTPFWCPALAPR